MRRMLHWGLAATLVTPMALMLVSHEDATAAGPANEAFYSTWARTDLPVREGEVTRTWMWGDGAFTQSFMEPYADSPDGLRQVQYFDKSRMEITTPHSDFRDDPWYVTNGLLARELITGEMQTGDVAREQRAPARVQIAGDNHSDSPTYADLEPLLSDDAADPGATLNRMLNPDGSVHADPSLTDYGVTGAEYVPDTDHTVASVFWSFMNSEGLVANQIGDRVTAPLFENPYFAVGFPITEAYWVHVPVAGVWQDVLVQCFERRCLTYTPENPDGWQVESGNIGQHYYRWRYVDGVIPEPAFAGGSGSASDPYQVATIQQLQDMRYFPDAHFVQVEDIDASETVGWNDGRGFEPIGSESSGLFPGADFSGSFDGSSFSIVGQTINRPDEHGVGLFSSSSGSISGVDLVDVRVSGYTYVGGIAGINTGSIEDSRVAGELSGVARIGGVAGDNRGEVTLFGWSAPGGTLSGVHSSGQISGGSYAGGVAGENSGYILASTSHMTVTGETDLGGLVGTNQHDTSHHGMETSAGVIRGSNASGDVSGDYVVGGLVGANTGPSWIEDLGLIEYSYATGDVYASERIAGGLTGLNDGIIHFAYATGDVAVGDRLAGGLVGWNQSFGSISVAYASGSVTGHESIGGLIGEYWGAANSDFAVSRTIATGHVSGDVMVGGMIGNFREGGISASYWDVESTGQPSAVGSGDSSGMHGLTTQQMTGSDQALHMPGLDLQETWRSVPGTYPILEAPAHLQ